MTSKLIFGLSCLLLIYAVYADDGLYIRGRKRGPYSVSGVDGVFDSAPGQHTYLDGMGNGYLHENDAAKRSQFNFRQGQNYNPDEGFISSPSNGNRPTKVTPEQAIYANPYAASPPNGNILPKAKNGFIFVHQTDGAGASTHIVDGPATQLINRA